MARTKNEIVADQFTIQERISNAAHGFTQQILHILGSGTLAELSALRDQALSGNGASSRALEQRAERPMPRLESMVEEDDDNDVLDEEVEDRILKDALAAEMPRVTEVTCPVEGCNNPGIRPKRNFCLKHSRMLTKTDQIKLLEQQKKRLRAEKQAGKKK